MSDSNGGRKGSRKAQVGEPKESIMMRRWINYAATALVAAAILLSTSTAWAQWGQGVEGDTFRLRPSVSLSMGFDSNIYHTSRSAAGRLHQAPVGVLTPSLSISTIDPDSWDLSAAASVGWRQFLSDEQLVRNQSGLSTSLSGTATWNADGAVSLQLSERFERTNETPSSPSRETLNRVFNRAGVMAGLHPGGRILETYGSYDFSLYRHNLFPDIDRHTHHLGWQGSWSFLPQTSLTADVDYRMIRYEREFRGQEQGVSPEGRLRNIDSNPFRVSGGLRGMLTPRISFGASAGYGWSRHVDGPSHEGFLARAQTSYQFGNVDFDNRLRAGYRFGFSDSTLGNFYVTHRALAGYEQGFVNNRLRLDLEVSGEIRDYASPEIEGAETVAGEFVFPENLSDLLLGVSASASFDVRDGWSVGARYNFRANLTEDEILVEGRSEDAIRDYQRHHVLLTTTLTY